MKLRILVAVTALGLVGACTGPGSASHTPNNDTGNMAFPTPKAQGTLGSTTTSGQTVRDTGNMAYPAPNPQGSVMTSPGGAQPTDTGNMAYPTPKPQGTVGRTYTR